VRGVVKAFSVYYILMKQLNLLQAKGNQTLINIESLFELRQLEKLKRLSIGILRLTRKYYTYK
jgi:hypothetical protein